VEFRITRDIEYAIPFSNESVRKYIRIYASILTDPVVGLPAAATPPSGLNKEGGDIVDSKMKMTAGTSRSCPR
jgi:hypothetical protein